jgi:hypothetical protein
MKFNALLAVSFLTATSFSLVQADPTPITSVTVTGAVTVPHNNGDTWCAAWAGDGNIYTPSNDSSGFKSKAGTNLHLNKVTGDDPAKLDGETINPMTEYGVISSLMSDGYTWKSSGFMALDHVLYWVIARHHYVSIQSAANSSIIKSTDGGKTWTRPMQENFDHPMFPGARFPTPYFIDYGQDGHQAVADGSDRYVYAMSNSGSWDNGDFMVLGRVPKSKIGNLNAADWQFFTSGDGANDATWNSNPIDAKPVINSPNHLAEGGPVYIPGKQCYFMIGWYYPAGGGRVTPDASKTTVWDFYTAPHPWGPWTKIDSHQFKTQGYYCPGVSTKFTSADGSSLKVFTAGDFQAHDPSPPLYALTVVSLQLK